MRIRWLAALGAVAALGAGCDCLPTYGDDYRCLRTSAATGVQDAPTVCALSLDEAESLECGPDFSSCTCTARDDTGGKCIYKPAERHCH